MRRFVIPTPEKLREMAPLVVIGNVENLAATWSAARRRAGSSSWDGKMHVCFRTENKRRLATIQRHSIGGEWKEIAEIEYTPGLKWCCVHLMENLKSAYEGKKGTDEI